jgi:hypothetical protein
MEPLLALLFGGAGNLLGNRRRKLAEQRAVIVPWETS